MMTIVRKCYILLKIEFSALSEGFECAIKQSLAVNSSHRTMAGLSYFLHLQQRQNNLNKCILLYEVAKKKFIFSDI